VKQSAAVKQSYVAKRNRNDAFTVQLHCSVFVASARADLVYNQQQESAHAHAEPTGDIDPGHR
jgi:hypothetical protein